jgi:hypothetical protein
MINYVMLVSRQGKFDDRKLLRIPVESLSFTIIRQGQIGKVVPNFATEGQGQDRQGRDSTGISSSDTDV